MKYCENPCSYSVCDVDNTNTAVCNSHKRKALLAKGNAALSITHTAAVKTPTSLLLLWLTPYLVRSSKCSVFWLAGGIELVFLWKFNTQLSTSPHFKPRLSSSLGHSLAIKNNYRYGCTWYSVKIPTFRCANTLWAMLNMCQKSIHKLLNWQYRWSLPL